MDAPKLSCEWIRENFDKPYARQEIGLHLESCSRCVGSTQHFFSELANSFQLALKHFSSIAAEFLQRAELHALRSCTPGTVDPSTALLIEQCNQLVENAASSYKDSPHNALRALVWLQHAFLLCRAFESEKFVEKAIAFEHKRLRVGSTLVPDGNGRTWSQETSASGMFSQHLPYGTFTFNFELHERIRAELNQLKFVHALVLICDPAKHGVMSPLLNVAATAHLEQIYALGLEAVSVAIREFLKNTKGPSHVIDVVTA